MATLESIQRELKVHDGQLDSEITDFEHFNGIAENICGSSNNVLQSAFLLTDDQRSDIHTETILKGQKSANLSLLRYWKERNAGKATYRQLMKAVLKFTKDAILARKIGALCAGIPVAAKMSTFGTTSLDELKARTGVKESQLAGVISDSHLRSIAEHVENWPQYAEELGLRGHQREDVRTSVELNYLMKTRKTFQTWKSNMPFNATYRRLIEAALALGDGQVAVETCSLCKGTEAPQSPDSFSSFPDWLESKGLSKKDIDTLTSEGFSTVQGFETLEPEDLEELGITKAGKKLIPKLLRGLGNNDDTSNSTPAGATPGVAEVGVVSSSSSSDHRNEVQQTKLIDYSKLDCSKFAYNILVKCSVKINQAMSKDPKSLANSLFSTGFIAQSTLDEISELNETKSHKASRLYSAVIARVKSFPKKYVDFVAILRRDRLLYEDLLREMDSVYESMN